MMPMLCDTRSRGAELATSAVLAEMVPAAAPCSARAAKSSQMFGDSPVRIRTRPAPAWARTSIGLRP